MQMPSKATVEARKARYKKGLRVELVRMNDPYTKLKPGDRGSVDMVDDTGSVFIDWDSGSHLAAVYGEDEIRLLTKVEVVKEQCRKVAQTGQTNMFDSKAAFEIAVAMGFTELADLIFMNTKAYSNLIFTGELADADLETGL